MRHIPKEKRLRIEPENLGTLELGGMWVPYIDLYDIDFLPTRVQIANDEYAFQSSMIHSGHGAVLPQRIRELRQAGKKAVVVDRDDRYYVFVSPP